MGNRCRRIWVVIALAWVTGTGPAGAELARTAHATVERVVDGDTLVAVSEQATKLRIRLLGIDAPEVAHGNKPGQPFGVEASRYLAQLVASRSVRLEMYGPDVYRRILAVVWVGEINVNVQMVQAGYAEVYRGARCRVYCRQLAEAEAGARRAHAGIWAQESRESPSAFRKRTKS